MKIKYSEISVAVAVYNGEKTLYRTLDSLKKQTFKNLNVLISDDCSTDNSKKIINEFINQCPNFYLIGNDKNIGMFNNYNKLFNISNSKYFAWVDQDDYRENLYFEKCFNELEKKKNAVLAFAHTGVKNKENNELMHINTINSLEGVFDVDTRYKNLIKNFNDTIVYSLIRSDILKKTDLWVNINGSANKLIYQLSLHGEFAQIREVLTYYYGMGLANRYDSKHEYLRSTKKIKNVFNLPFLILFINQFKDLLLCENLNYLKKIKIGFFVILDLFFMNLSKFIYRILSIFKNKKLSNLTYKIINTLLNRNNDIINIVDVNKYPLFYPKHHPFKKVKGKEK